MDGDGDSHLSSHTCHPLCQDSAKNRREERYDESKPDSVAAQPFPVPHDQLLLPRIAVEAGEEGEPGDTSGHKVELLTDAPTIREAK